MSYTDIGVTVEDKVAIVEIQKGPNNFFDVQMINDLADIFASYDEGDEARAIVLCSEGKHFCAGNDFSNQAQNVVREGRQQGDRVQISHVIGSNTSR